MKYVSLTTVVGLGAICGLAPGEASAEDPTPSGDAIAFRVTADTYARLFRRASTFGPGGSILETETAAPLHQYALLRVADVDLPWDEDSVDVELGAWGQVHLLETDIGQRLDGDVTTANVRYRFSSGHVAVGRQIYAGGAARFVRFDGASARAIAPFGLGIDGYGGFSVLPQWSARPGYYQLGSASDALLRTPDALEPTDRADHWLAGARTFYRHPKLGEIAVSFHEEQETGGVAARRVGAELRTDPVPELSVFGQANVDADSGRVIDARAIAETRPHRGVTISPIYHRVEPALYLSRQSVLSVFATDAYDELGVETSYRPRRDLSLASEGHVQILTSGDIGGRGALRTRYSPAARERPIVGVTYRRIVEPQNGYHGVRVSLSLTPFELLQLGAEANGYLYDEPIRGLSTSWLTAFSARQRLVRWLAVTLSGSFARSPYALVDGQVLARVEVDLEGGAR